MLALYLLLQWPAERWLLGPAARIGSARARLLACAGVLGLRLTALQELAWVMVVGTVAGSGSSIFIVGTFAACAISRDPQEGGLLRAAEPVESTGVGAGAGALREPRAGAVGCGRA